MTSPRSTDPLTPTLAAVVTCCVLGLAAVYHATLGFRVVSTEAGRRLEIAEHPAILPEFTLYAGDGRSIPFSQAIAHDARTMIVVFFYTRCLSVCSVLGSELEQLQNKIAARGLTGRIGLLAISFDPLDDRQALAGYASRMHAAPAIWQVYGILFSSERQRALSAFGVTVIPDSLGGYTHNAAFHIVDQHGRLRNIIGYEEPDRALELALEAAG